MRINKRVNSLWVSPDGGPVRKSCEYCHVRYEYINSVLRCPQCGSQGTAEDMVNETKRGLVAAHVSEPMIGKRRKKGEDENDMPLPPGGVWISDEVIEPQ